MFTVIIYRKRSGHHCYSVKAIGFQKLLFEKLPLLTRTLGPFQGALWDTEICMVLWLSILCLSKCLDLFIAGQKRCSDNHLPSATASPLGSLREDAGLLDSSFINMVMRVNRWQGRGFLSVLGSVRPMCSGRKGVRSTTRQCSQQIRNSLLCLWICCGTLRLKAIISLYIDAYEHSVTKYVFYGLHSGYLWVWQPHYKTKCWKYNNKTILFSTE